MGHPSVNVLNLVSHTWGMQCAKREEKIAAFGDGSVVVDFLFIVTPIV